MDKFTLNCTYLLETLKFNEESEANLWKSAIGNKSNMENIYLFQNEHDAFIFMHAQSRFLIRLKIEPTVQVFF